MVVILGAIIEYRFLGHMSFSHPERLTVIFPWLVAFLSGAIIAKLDKSNIYYGISFVFIIYVAFLLLMTGSLVILLISLASLALINIVFKCRLSISTFAVYFGLITVLLYIPHLSEHIAIDKYYYLISFFALLGILIYFKKNLINIKDEPLINLNFVERFGIYAITIVLGFHVLPFNFVFDDLNGYLWVPKVSEILNHTAVSELLPSSLTFYTQYNLGIVSYIAFLTGISDVVQFVFTWKFIQFIFLIIAILITIVELKNNKRLEKYTYPFLIVLFPGFLSYQIVGNQNDFPAIFATYLSIFWLLRNKFISPKELLGSILIVAISPKAFLPLFVAILVLFFRHIKNSYRALLSLKYYLSLIFGLLLLIPMYVRNYFLTGNAFFPSGNNKYKSDLFPVDFFVADRWTLPSKSGFHEYFDLVFNNLSNLKIFYASSGLHYGPISIVLIITLIVSIFLSKRRVFEFNKDAFIFLGLSYLMLLIANNTIGAQHRYLIPVMIFFVFFLALLILDLFKEKDRKYIFISIFFVINFHSFTVISGVPKFEFKENLMQYSGKNYIDRLVFYNKVNRLIGSEAKIILYYLQDKLFLDSIQLTELDWYDYVPSSRLQIDIDEIKQKSITQKPNNEVQSYLCNRGYSHMILSNSVDPYDVNLREVMQKILSGPGVNLYQLECNQNLKKLRKKELNKIQIKKREIETQYLNLKLTHYPSTEKNYLINGGGLSYYKNSEIVYASSSGNFYRFFSKNGIFEKDFLPQIFLGGDEIGESKKYKILEIMPRVLDVVFHKEYFYVTYTKYDSKLDEIYFEVSKIKENTQEWVQIYRSIPLDSSYFTQGNGGELAAYEDMIYFSIGDQSLDSKNNLPSDFAAQKDYMPWGKVFRYNLSNNHIELCSKGHRNPQGLFVSEGGLVYETEHGPRGGDEINIIKCGKNYGWPNHTYGTKYGSYESNYHSEEKISNTIEQPIFFFTPSIAITDIIKIKKFHDSWNGAILVGSLKAESLYILRSLDSSISNIERINIGARIRDIIELKGNLFVLSDGGEIIKIEPGDANSLASGSHSAVHVCLSCHGMYEKQGDPYQVSLDRIFNNNIFFSNPDHYSENPKLRNLKWNEHLLKIFIRNPKLFSSNIAMPAIDISDEKMNSLINVLKQIQKVDKI